MPEIAVGYNFVAKQKEQPPMSKFVAIKSTSSSIQTGFWM